MRGIREGEHGIVSFYTVAPAMTMAFFCDISVKYKGLNQLYWKPLKCHQSSFLDCSQVKVLEPRCSKLVLKRLCSCQTPHQLISHNLQPIEMKS